jgi:hypothetical protein
MKPHARACLHASRARGTGARRHACTRAHASRTCTRTHVRTRTRTRERLDITRDKRTGNRDNRTGAQPQHNTSQHITSQHHQSQHITTQPISSTPIPLPPPYPTHTTTGSYFTINSLPPTTYECLSQKENEPHRPPRFFSPALSGNCLVNNLQVTRQCFQSFPETFPAKKIH